MSATSVGKRNISLIYLSCLFGNGYFARAIFMLYLLDQGYSLLEVGVLQSLVNLAMFVCEIPTGVVADRWGRKTSLIIGRILIVLYFGGMVYADNFYTVAAAFLLLGVGVTFISGSEEALLFDSAKEDGKEVDFTRIAGRYSAIITLILALTMGVGGYLKEVSWTLVFICSIGFQLLSIVFTLFLKEIKQEASEEPRSITYFIKDTAAFLKMNVAVRVLILGIAIYSGVVSIYLLFVQQLFNEMSYTAYFISTLSGVVALVSAVASDKAHVLEKRFSPRSVLLATVLIAAVFFLLIFPSISYLSIIAFLMIQLCLYVAHPVSYTLINMEIPSSQRATLLSMMNFVSSLFMFVLAPIIGYMAQQFGAQKFLALVGGASMALVGVCIVYFFKTKQPSEPEFDAEINETG